MEMALQPKGSSAVFVFGLTENKRAAAGYRCRPAAALKAESWLERLRSGLGMQRRPVPAPDLASSLELRRCHSRCRIAARDNGWSDRWTIPPPDFHLSWV